MQADMAGFFLASYDIIIVTLHYHDNVIYKIWVMYKYIISFLMVSFFVFGRFSLHVFADTLEYKNLPIKTDGDIFVMNERDSILYIGGSFTQVQINDGVVENRKNIAAISLPEGVMLPWNPTIDIVVKSIQFDGDMVIVKDYLETQEDKVQPRNQVIINSNSGEINNPPVTATPTPKPVTVVSNPAPPEGEVEGLMVDRAALGFRIPTLSDILTFAIRGFFVISGLAALFFLLMGAFTWVTSGGDKDSVQAARDKMQAAIVGVLMMVAVLGIVWTLEQVVLGGNLCFGISCPVSLPTLLEPT